MPGFAEGQDPLDQGASPSFGINYAPKPPDPFSPSPSGPDVIGAAFRQANPVVSVIDAINRGPTVFPPVPGYNPVPRIVGTKYESLLTASIMDTSPDETSARMAKFDAEQKDIQTLDEAGPAGHAVEFGAGLLDPSWAIPLFGEARAYGKGLSVAQGLARGAAEGAVRSTVSEAALSASQVSRTPGEAGADVATNTLLMGLIGGGARWLEGGERKGAVDGLEAMRRDLTPGAAPAMAEDVGAAAADKRTMVLSPILPPVVRDAIAAIPGGDAALNAMRQIGLAASPSGRTFLNGSLPGARTMGDLAETSLKFTQAAEGQTASTLGTVPISRISRMQRMRFEQVNRDALEDAFAQYRGKSGPSILVRAQAAVENLTGNNDGKMNFDEFKKQVYLAQTQGGEHPIPEVAKAARDVTAKVYDPVLKFAQSVKDKDGRPVIAEAIGPPAGDKGFAPRIFNKPAIAEDPNGFDQKNLEWLTGEQAKKADIQERIGRIHYNLTNSEDLAESLEGRIERRTGALEIVQNKAEEVRRLNEFAYKRSEKLSKPLDELREKIRGITDKISPSLDRLSKLAEDIKTEKANFPEIKDADARIFKLIGAAQKLKQSRDIVDTIDNATEFADTIDDVIGGAKDQIREASAHAKDVRLTSGSNDLLALEKERTNVRKEVAPYLKQLNQSRRDLRGLEEARTPGARGGSVFETKIRDRGNALADQASGRAHEIDAMADRLAQERKAQTELRAELEGELGKWEGKTTDEVNSALKARAEAEAARKEKMAAGTYQGSGERLTGADSAVDRAVKRVLGSKQDLSQDELMSLAREIRNRINTAADGRLPYDMPSGGPQLGYGEANPVRGSLNGRDFAIPTANILKYVHTDMEHVVPAYLRTIIPDLHLMKRFGDVEMSEQFKKVNEWYDGLAAKETDAKKLMKIDASRKAEVRDLAATRDRIRGVYGMPTNQTQRNFGRVARAVGNWNVGTFLGTSMLNRFQDMANATARRGLLGYMGDGFLPFIKGASRIDAGSAASRQFMKDIGVGVDTVSGHSASLFWDVVNNHLPGNRFERGLRASANTAMIVTGHTPWTDMNKQIAGMAASAEFLRMADRIAEGAHTERDIRSMAHAGIDPAMARRISKSFNDGGFTQVGDAKVPNTADWKDAGAREAFEAAIQKDADIAVITPGAEKPLFLSDPTMALLGQFKGFAFAAQERILISNLQEADGRTLQGLLHMLGMGAMSYAAYSLATGQAMSNRPQDWVKEAVTRAGMMGWMSDVNAMQAKFTGGKTDAWRGIGADRPLSRHTSQSALEEMLGPTFALLNGVAQAGTDASFGAWSAKDTHKLRQAMFLQNHFLFRKLLDEAEDGFNQHLGIKPLNRDPTVWAGGPPKQ